MIGGEELLCDIFSLGLQETVTTVIKFDKISRCRNKSLYPSCFSQPFFFKMGYCNGSSTSTLTFPCWHYYFLY